MLHPTRSYLQTLRLSLLLFILSRLGIDLLGKGPPKRNSAPPTDLEFVRARLLIERLHHVVLKCVGERFRGIALIAAAAPRVARKARRSNAYAASSDCPRFHCLALLDD